MSVASSDTYEVIFEVRDAPMAAGIEKMVADSRRLDAQWTSTMNNMRQRTAALADGAGDSVKKIPSMFDGVKKSVGDATSEIGRMAVGFAVFTVGRQLITGMRDALVDLRQYTVTMNKELTDMQLKLAEVQSITGRAGAGGAQVLQEHLELMKYTGMTSEQAMKFTGEFVGEAEIYRPRYDPGQFAEIQNQAARFAMIHGGDAASHAILSGRLMGMMPEGQRTAEAVETKQADLYRRLNLAPGRTEALNQSYVQSLATLVSPTGQGGMVGSAEELANLYIPGSRVAGTPAKTASTMERFARVVTGQIRGKEWTPFLRDELNIPEGTPTEQAMIPIFNRMASEQARGTDLPTWLRGKGIGNSKEISTLIGMFNQRQDYFDAVAKVRAEPMTPAMARQTLTDPYTMGREGFRPELAIRRNEAAEKAVELQEAQQNQMAEVFRGRARVQLRQENQIGPRWQAGLSPVERADMLAKGMVQGEAYVERQKVDERALQLFEREYGQTRGHRAQLESDRAWYNRPGFFGKPVDSYVGAAYVQSNQFAQEVNEGMLSRRIGIDPATGAATGRASKDTKILEDIERGVRKDRPMTVAKPAPSPRP
jgi:hypothetical protein